MHSVNIDALVAELTIDEKISLLAGASTWHTVAIDRLSIPALKVSSCANQKLS